MNSIFRQICIIGMAFFLGMIWAIPTELFYCHSSSVTFAPAFTTAAAAASFSSSNETEEKNGTHSSPSTVTSNAVSLSTVTEEHRDDSSRLSLLELLQWPTRNENSCPEGQVTLAALLQEWNNQVRQTANTNHSEQRRTKIPSTIHVGVPGTAETCVAPDQMNQWKDQFTKVSHSYGWTIFWHGAWMRDALIWESSWPEFPFLPLIRPCVATDTPLWDLWSALTLYEYGGMAVLFEPDQVTWTTTLIDNTISQLTKNRPPHQALVWYTREWGFLPQVLASAPRPHSFPYLWVMDILERSFRTPLRVYGDNEQDPVANGIVTGFGALNGAVRQFLMYPIAELRQTFHYGEKMLTTSSGKYTGLHGYQLTIAHSKLESNKHNHTETTKTHNRLTNWEYPGIERKKEAWPESCFHELYRATRNNQLNTI